MERIELSPYDKKDLLDILDYAKEMKLEYQTIQDGSKYWEMRIEQLKQILNGKVVRDGVYRSSLGTIEMSSTHEEKQHQRYLKRKEEEK